MRGNSIWVGAIVLSILFSFSAVAEEARGRTSDGCSYKVINGQYLTSCAKKGETSAPAASGAAPVGSYSDVPVRHNEAAPQPIVIVQQPAPARNGGLTSAIVDADGETTFDAREEIRRERIRSKLVDQTYAGVLLGASNMKESNSGSSVGAGINIGTNINDTFGVELGYTYAKQKLNMGLASRTGNGDDGADIAPAPTYPGQPLGHDSTLASHLITTELQAHLTDPVKRLRPYIGAGLGWRSATLQEVPAENFEMRGQNLGGSLHQNTFGGLLGAGTKLRVAKALNLGFAFRYFFPIASSDARLEQPVAPLAGLTPSESRISSADDSLTSSSQYQILGGLQYSF